jgi:hypothetical protein
MFVFVVAQVGCVRSPDDSTRSSPASIARPALSGEDAALLAARLANEQCERQYQRRPFVPGQYAAIIQDGLYHWGHLDVGGPGGFSALVTIRRDGSQPKVEVYFSSDSAL